MSDPAAASHMRPRARPAGVHDIQQFVLRAAQGKANRHPVTRALMHDIDLRTIQLMLGHASLTQTQRSLNLTDEELRRAVEVSWEKKKRLRLVSGA